MSSFYGIDTSNNSFSWLLSGSSNSTSSTSSAGGLGDYALIQSGAYKKLLNSYYNKKADEASSDKEKTEKVNMNLAKNSADSLNSAASELMSTEISEENRGTLLENIKQLVESYNQMIDNGSDVDDTSVLRNTLWMTQSTAKNSGLLSDIGIKIGEGNKLTLDEESFNSASLTTMKSLFTGKDSFVGRLAARAGSITRATQNALGEKTASAYSNKGTAYKSVNTSSIIDSFAE